MKRILLALLIGGATLTSLSSCTKEYVTNYLPGVTYKFDLPSESIGDWKRIGTTGSYRIEIPFPELDQKYHDFGVVNIAISYNNKPNSFINIESADDNYDYKVESEVGKITIVAHYLGKDGPFAPDPMLMKVTLTDADDGGN